MISVKIKEKILIKKLYKLQSIFKAQSIKQCVLKYVPYENSTDNFN